MKRSRFSEEQIIAILKEQESGMATPGAKREAIAHAREHHGVSERAAERRRFSYRRLGYLLAREGITPNHKKLLRIYPRGGLAGASPWREEAGVGHAQTDGAARWSQPALVARLRLRQPDLRP